MVRPFRSRPLCQNTSSLPLGKIGLAGYLDNSPGISEHSMRTLGAWALVYVLDGGGMYCDAPGRRQAIGPGDLILVFPDVPHAYHPGEDGRWNEIFFIFDGPVFDLWRSQGVLNERRPVYHLQPVDLWRRRLEAVATNPLPMVQICLLQQALAEAVEMTRAADVAETDRAWLDRARRSLDATDLSEVDWHGLAGGLGMSYEGFRKRFARLTGTSPGRYRTRRVIERASRLLQRPDAKLAEIAYRCGFCDEFHFSRRFKQVTGISPREFRRQLAGEGNQDPQV